MMIPRPGKYLIRASFFYFLIGGSIGIFILWSKADVRFNWAWRLFSIHLDFMLFGWFMQFVLSVAYWILPRYMKKPVRGPGKPIWSGFVLVNAGLMMVAVAPFYLAEINLLFIGRIFIASGALMLLSVIAPRVKPFVLPPEAIAKMEELRKKKAEEEKKLQTL